MSRANPLITIAIATRNRAPYAISAIKSILRIPDSRLELVVQDNSDTTELQEYACKEVRDERFRYRYTPQPLSSIDNFNAAVELATGEYVCMIGDDDGINPEIVEAAAWAKAQDLDSLSIRARANYLWSGANVASTLFTRVSGSSLTVASFEGTIRQSDPEAEMHRLMRNGGLYYLSFDLPKLYHGLVHRRCLHAVRERTGAYFGGLSPDVFASIAVACIAKRVAVTDYPLTIPGACPVSGSVTEGSANRRSMRLADAPHFRNRRDYEWSSLVPRVYTAETIWVDSEISALRAMGREDLIEELNLSKLAAYCIRANNGVAGPVLRHLFTARGEGWFRSTASATEFGWSVITGPGVQLARRAWNRVLLTLRLRRDHTIGGLEDMVEASIALTGFLKDTERDFKTFARARDVA